ncbi:MAG: glycosyl transferase, group 1, partial [Pseudomonadota bacterium]
MKICFTSASFDAAYGGPALSVSHLAAAVAETGADAAIWAPDGSAVTSEVVPSDGKITRLDGSF